MRRKFGWCAGQGANRASAVAGVVVNQPEAGVQFVDRHLVSRIEGFEEPGRVLVGASLLESPGVEPIDQQDGSTGGQLAPAKARAVRDGAFGERGKFNSVPGAGVFCRNDFEQGDVLRDPIGEHPEIIGGKIRNRAVVVANHHIDLNKPGFHSQDVRTLRLLLC